VKLPADIESAQSAQHDVQQDHVREFTLGDLDAPETVFGGKRSITARFEEGDVEAEHEWIVINAEHRRPTG
jgi:hypothetical protein